MQDRAVSLGKVIAATGWSLALICAAAGCVLAIGADDNSWALTLMVCGVMLAAGAATWTVRMFFCQQNRLLSLAWQLGSEGRGSVRKIKP